jgi:hypothetical protein
MMELIYDLAPEQIIFCYCLRQPGWFLHKTFLIYIRQVAFIVMILPTPGVFRDDIIARAVNTVTASGAILFFCRFR